MRKLLFYTILLLCFSGCKKTESATIERDLDASNLTACPANGCNFDYSEWGDVKEDLNLTAGKFRVFRTELIDHGITSVFFIKAPMNGVAFKMEKSALASGLAIWSSSCNSCRLIQLAPEGGTVRGARMLAENNSSVEKWVIELKVTLSDGDLHTRYLNIKQIFYPDFYNPDPT